MSKVKTTEKDFERFKAECLKWIDRFHLNDWDVAFCMEDLRDANAEVSYQKGNRKALFRLGSECEAFSTIEDYAKHECLELLLADLAVLSSSFFSEDLINDEVHKVINKLMVAL